MSCLMHNIVYMIFLCILKYSVLAFTFLSNMASYFIHSQIHNSHDSHEVILEDAKVQVRVMFALHFVAKILPNQSKMFEPIIIYETLP